MVHAGRQDVKKSGKGQGSVLKSYRKLKHRLLPSQKIPEIKCMQTGFFLNPFSLLFSGENEIA